MNNPAKPAILAAALLAAAALPASAGQKIQDKKAVEPVESPDFPRAPDQRTLLG